MNWKSSERSSAFSRLVPKITTFHFTRLKTSRHCCTEGIAGFIPIRHFKCIVKSVRRQWREQKQVTRCRVFGCVGIFWSASTFWAGKLVCRLTHHLNKELVMLLLPTVYSQKPVWTHNDQNVLWSSPYIVQPSWKSTCFYLSVKNQSSFLLFYTVGWNKLIGELAQLARHEATTAVSKTIRLFYS